MKIKFSELINLVKEDGYILNQSDHFAEIAYGLEDSAVNKLNAIRNNPEFDQSSFKLYFKYGCQITRIIKTDNGYQFLNYCGDKCKVANRSFYLNDQDSFSICSDGIEINLSEDEDKRLVLSDYGRFKDTDTNIKFWGFNESVSRFIWSLFGLTDELINDLFEEYSNPNERNNMSCFRISDYQKMIGCHTKRDVIEKFYPDCRLFKEINEMPLYYGLLFADTQALIRSDQISYFTEIVSRYARSALKNIKCYGTRDYFPYWGQNNPEVYAAFLEQIYSLDHPECNDSGMKNDVFYCFKKEIESNEPVVLKRSYTAIEKKRDDQILLQKIQDKKICCIPDSPLKYLEMPENYALLDTKEALYYEKLDHGFWTGFYPSIFGGKCVIYHGEVLGESLTIAVHYDKYRDCYDVLECTQTGGQKCSDSAKEQVQKDLNSVTKPALERYKEVQGILFNS